MCKQEANETVDAFVTALYGLGEHCNNGTLHDELIRDRIVVGLADMRLSERMQMQKDLDLEKSINMVKQSEEIKKQQNTLRSEVSGVKQTDARSVDGVFKGRQHKEKAKFKTKSCGAMQHNGQSKSPKRSHCYKCGGTAHPKQACPSNNAKCCSCGKMGHYQHVCLAGKSVHRS